ncbi:TVP38/TMEM64 family protein [Mycobacterium sp. BMJ-28]
MKPVAPTLRAVWAAVTSTAAQIPRRRVMVISAAIVILVALVLLVPLPNAVQLRDWATSVGPWFPLAFFAAHVVVTVFPFPRTAFTLAAGLLFGPWLGVTIAVVASALSAVLALILVRAAGWQLSRLVRHPRVDSLDARLRERGWVSVLSMRMIPAVPFSVLNYAAGASAVRPVPYTLATIVGLTPGTAAIVILGDAMTGNISPLLFLVSLCTAAVGFGGLIFEVRAHRRHHRVQRSDGQPAEVQQT